MNHKVGRVCFDDGASARFTNDVGLDGLLETNLGSGGLLCTMSQPSFADAIAEK